MPESLLVVITALIMLPGALCMWWRYRSNVRWNKLEEESKLLLLEKERIEIALMRRKLEILENEEEFEKLKKWLES
jgi:hypothetical protein